MGFWVRTQDKTELINSKRFQVEGQRIYVFTGSDEDNWVAIAEYKTKERAVEVLDDMQNELTNITPASEAQFIRVYQMPKE